MSLARILFILAAVPFTLLALEAGNENSEQGWHGPPAGVLVFCGGAFVYGSIWALRDGMPLALRVFFGFTLNVLGACVWVLAFRRPENEFIGWTGVVLCLSWLSVIIREYREERH